MQWILTLVALALAVVACLYPMSLAASLEAERTRAAAVAERQEARLAALDGWRGDPELEMAALRKRIAGLEQAVARRQVPLAAPVEAAGPQTPAPAPAPQPGITPVQRQELARLSAQVMAPGFDYETGTQAVAALIKLARSGGLVDARIQELEAAVASQPDDLTSRERLAEVYFAKLMTVAGPEQGVYHGRAQAQWRAILERDPQHLRAHAILGHGYAYYPDASGKTGAAIKHLEQARRIQERRGGKIPGAVQTYVVLARLYQRRGDKARARAVLQDGLRYHQADPQLRRALEEL